MRRAARASSSLAGPVWVFVSRLRGTVEQFFSSFYKALGDHIGGEKDGGLKEAEGGKIVIMLTQLTVRCAARSRCKTVYAADKWPSVDGRGRESGWWLGGADPARILLCKPTLGYSTLLYSMKNTHTHFIRNSSIMTKQKGQATLQPHNVMTGCQRTTQLLAPSAQPQVTEQVRPHNPLVFCWQEEKKTTV